MGLKEYRDIESLHIWEKNPRTISQKDFGRLKKQLKKLGQYKPLVITEDGTVLGGNMRLKAYQEMGIKDIWVSVVEADTEVKKVEYALSDNDRAGTYIEDDLLALVKDLDLDLDLYAVDLGEMSSLSDLFKDQEVFDEDYSDNLGEIVYEPKETHHKVSDLYQPDNKYDADIESLENEELKQMLRARAANFHNFNYEKIADYYAYQATPEEQRVFEKLALVLLDRNKLIENGFSKLIDKIDLGETEYEAE
jgi:hypothetical protein